MGLTLVASALDDLEDLPFEWMAFPGDRRSLVGVMDFGMGSGLRLPGDR
jgi:hypothetical protein